MEQKEIYETLNMNIFKFDAPDIIVDSLPPVDDDN